MAAAKRYLRVWLSDGGHEAIPVGPRYKLDPDSLQHEWITVKALDGSTVYFRTATVARAQVANSGTF